MRRAMRDAQAEMDEDEDSGSGSNEDDEGGMLDEASEDDGDVEEVGGESEDGDEDEDESMASEGEQNMEGAAVISELNPSSAQTPLNPNHLPDHLFTAAFSSQSAQPSTSKRHVAGSSAQKNHPRKRRANTQTPKDLIIG